MYDIDLIFHTAEGSHCWSPLLAPNDLRTVPSKSRKLLSRKRLIFSGSWQKRSGDIRTPQAVCRRQWQGSPAGPDDQFSLAITLQEIGCEEAKLLSAVYGRRVPYQQG